MIMRLSMCLIVFLTNLLSLSLVTLNLTFLLIIKDNWPKCGQLCFFPLTLLAWTFLMSVFNFLPKTNCKSYFLFQQLLRSCSTAKALLSETDIAWC